MENEAVATALLTSDSMNKPKLSVCIPIYNFDVNTLVKNLHQQLIDSNINFEILLMDDGSKAKFQPINSPLGQLTKCVYMPLTRNVGRAAIRNQLATFAKYPYLLFMDCDAKAPDDFIQNYIEQINKETEVIVGGRSYQRTPPKNSKHQLHWQFGLNREVFSAEERTWKPYSSFLTCNFLVKKKSFNKSLLMSA